MPVAELPQLSVIGAPLVTSQALDTQTRSL